MAGMVRKQVYIEKRQDEALKRAARRRGVTEAELVREALDLRSRDSGLGMGPDLYDERVGRWTRS
jgi:hypothetical protein